MGLKKDALSEVKQMFIPFGEPPKKIYRACATLFALAVILVWQFLTPTVIPGFDLMLEELGKMITQEGLLYEIGVTTWVCLKGFTYSAIIALSLAYSGKVVPIMRPVAFFGGKMRFWSSYGFSAIILIFTTTTQDYKTVMFVFGITPFLLAEFNAVMSSIGKEWFQYGHTLRLSKVQMFYYSIVRNTAPSILLVMQRTFAIAWVLVIFIEVSVRSEGGFGLMLHDSFARFVNENGYAKTFALQIFVLLLIGICIDFGLNLLTRWVFPYHFFSTDKNKK